MICYFLRSLGDMTYTVSRAIFTRNVIEIKIYHFYATVVAATDGILNIKYLLYICSKLQYTSSTLSIAYMEVGTRIE